jgi:ribosomal protein S14
MESATAVPGRRERSKLDKRHRIGEAARAVFNEFGYERANMREIAKRAGVATGTIFAVRAAIDGCTKTIARGAAGTSN